MTYIWYRKWWECCGATHLAARLRSTPGQDRPCSLSCSNMRLLSPCRRNTDDRKIQLYFYLIFENEHCLSLHKSALGLFEVAVSLSCLSAVTSSVPLAQVLQPCQLVQWPGFKCHPEISISRVLSLCPFLIDWCCTDERSIGGTLNGWFGRL